MSLSERVREAEAVAAEAVQKVEASRQESSALRSDLVGLRKEVQSAKAAPAALGKERDAAGREMEKTKAKLKDTDAKLKTALQEKHTAQVERGWAGEGEVGVLNQGGCARVQGERAKMEQELRRLQGQSNQLSRRESVAERRRESMAAGLSKAKGQALSVEQQLHHKAAEMEKLQFDMEVLQSSAGVAEARVAEAEQAVGAALGERDELIGVVEEGRGHMRDVEEQLRGLREEHAAMLAATASLQHSLLLAAQQASRAEGVEEELAAVRGQLTDSFLELESQRAVWAAESRAEQERLRQCVAEEKALQQQLAARLAAGEAGMARERMAAEEERVKAVCVLEGRVEMLSEQLEEAQEQEKADRAQLHLTEERRDIEREDEMRLLRNRVEKAERQLVLASCRTQAHSNLRQDERSHLKVRGKVGQGGPGRAI